MSHHCRIYNLGSSRLVTLKHAKGIVTQRGSGHSSKDAHRVPTTDHCPVRGSNGNGHAFQNRLTGYAGIEVPSATSCAKDYGSG